MQVLVRNSLFVGHSRPEVCTMCTTMGQSGCPPKPSDKSYNQVGEAAKSSLYVS